ncbi:acyl-CoA dehydrogenase family protein [Desulfobacula sp.]|uniref:acyl-CoA dehydrogenase family protein n=1 Tax=Desulfobacula sp. TaxID=2593537 RepID=UPI0026025A09|nr:acyl-CoA dehydrogenase family protein [Desulfobacula sp.]
MKQICENLEKQYQEFDDLVLWNRSKKLELPLIIKAAGGGGKGKGTEIHKLAAAAILLAGEVANRAANESLQLHGGYGYTTEYPINRFYRNTKLIEIGAGTSDIRRLVVADELIKKGTGY